jgi:plastocyanin
MVRTPVAERSTTAAIAPATATTPALVRIAVPAALAALAALAAAPAVALAAPGAGSAAAAAAATGTIKGTVVFDGPAPDRPKIRTETDPYCAKTEVLVDDVIVTKGKLSDVLVRVKNGSLKAPATAPPAAPPPAVIDQKDCRYVPRVLGVVVGQKISIRNADQTFHNVHGEINGQLVWNKPSGQGDPPIVVDGSAKAGDVIDVKCDVHNWMHAFAVVQDHTAFAVTGEDGGFEIKGLAPGSYTLEAWHPTLGTRTVTVKLGKGAHATATAKFSFSRAEPKK